MTGGLRRPGASETLRLWLPVLVWAAFIFYLSSLPHLRFVKEWYDLLIRKTGHMLVFGILARLLVRALSESTYWSWKKIFVWSFCLSVLYACSDEVHQSFVPGRGASPVDVGIDALGTWLALGLKP